MPFVDHHVHLLAVAGGRAAYGDVAAFHREVAARGSTPMDEPYDGALSGDELDASILGWLEKAASYGLVSITEAGMRDWSHWESLLRLRARDRLPLRVRVLVASGVADMARMERTGDDSVDLEGVKFYADGWLGPRTCACSQPFLDGPQDDGILFMTADDLVRRASPYAEAGWTIATHAIGDRGIETVLDAYDRLAGSGVTLRVEHAQVLRADLIARMAESGVVACIQPCFAASDADHVRAGLGADRFPDAYRWDRLLDARVRVITGSDFPIEPLDPAIGLDKLAAIVGRDRALELMTR